MSGPPKKVISVLFFKLGNGSEPVRDWLLDLSNKEKNIIGTDIKTVEIGWPLGMPLVEKLDSDLWEVRTKLPAKKISRVLFTVSKGDMVLLHGFIKKSKKIPKPDLTLAKKRRNLVLGGKK